MLDRPKGMLIVGFVPLMVAAVTVTIIESRPAAGNPDSADWPDKFTSSFHVLVEEYGDGWNSTGIVYYDWSKEAFRSDFFDWCIPLFDSGTTDRNNYTCSFLAIHGNMYFVNHTGSSWGENDCCLFEKNLGAVPPNWMQKGINNGTATVNNALCNVYWFPGTLCIAYWSSVDKATPIRFFGISSLGPAILDYFNFLPNLLPSKIEIDLPNPKCDRKCVPPSIADETPDGDQEFASTVRSAANEPHKTTNWPFKWPTC